MILSQVTILLFNISESPEKILCSVQKTSQSTSFWTVSASVK